MKLGLIAGLRSTALLVAGLLCVWQPPLGASPMARQQALDEWRNLTSGSAASPEVLVKGERAHFFFTTTNGPVGYSAEWHRRRVPTDHYRVNAAVLRWDGSLERGPQPDRGWRQATVIAGPEWRQLATNLIETLTPATPMHAAYYEAFLSDGVLYRDLQGGPHFVALGEQPRNVVIEHRCSVEETLEIMARLIEKHLALTHPGESLFVILAPNARHCPEPILLDRQQRRCVLLTPAALYDATDRGLGLDGTAQNVWSLLLESHGIALVKNPVSSLARLGDFGFQEAVLVLRHPLPGPGKSIPPLVHTNGMDLAQWEDWLDAHTGTRPEQGALQLLIDGDRFFPRLQQAINQATNHIHFNVYIFDRDDTAVGIADQLKARSKQLDVKVLMDQMGSISAGAVPPPSPLAEGFTPPKSIGSYLRQDSKVHVRKFLNPWFSADHSKIYLIDGTHAWIGGMNVGHEYRYDWHDLMVELQGPVVTSLERDFQKDWAHAGWLGDLAFAATVLSKGPNIPNCSGSTNFYPVRRLMTRTAWKPLSAAVMGSIERAQQYIYVENPYLFDKHVIRALVRARQRGVDVRVVLPRINDLKPGMRSNLVVANYLLQHGVRVFFYPGMSHVKGLMVDGWVCLGSANLNHLSLRLCQEQNIATSHPAFVQQVRQQLFEEDFERSYELTAPISVDWVDFLAEEMLENF